MWVLVFLLHREMCKTGNPYCEVEEDVTDEPVTDPQVTDARRADFRIEEIDFLKVFIHKIYSKLVSLSVKFSKAQNPILDRTPMSSVYNH